jgi:ankyrin repeat protein
LYSRLKAELADYAINKESKNLLRLLILLGTNLRLSFDKCARYKGFAQTSLELAVVNNNLKMVKFLTSKWLKNCHTQESLNKSLVRAFMNKNYEIVEILLQNGADPNHILSDDVWFPHENLILNCSKDAQMVRLLIKYGAHSPCLSYIIMHWNEDNLDIVLENGQYQSQELNQALLYTACKNIPARIDSGFIASVLRAGANVNARDEYNNTALKLNNDFASAIDLINAGANLNAQDNNGDTPLMVMARHAHANNDRSEIIYLLLCNGADTTIKNAEDKTFYDYAQDKPEVQAVIKEFQKYAAKEILKSDVVIPDLASIVAEYV